jgi:hypothetical protein
MQNLEISGALEVIVSNFANLNHLNFGKSKGIVKWAWPTVIVLPAGP